MAACSVSCFAFEAPMAQAWNTENINNVQDGKKQLHIIPDSIHTQTLISNKDVFIRDKLVKSSTCGLITVKISTDMCTRRNHRCMLQLIFQQLVMRGQCSDF